MVIDETSLSVLPLYAALAAAALFAIGELLHVRRMSRLASLAFGPTGRPETWVYAVPFLRVAAASAAAWGLTTLMLLEPRVHRAEQSAPGQERHVLLVLDVSPSMRLDDAGPEAKQTRMQRAHDVMESFFQRVPLDQYRISVVAVYNGAKPVVVGTRDLEVVRNILGDLPMHHAFVAGKTDLFAGIEEAARVAKPWRPGSATMILMTDGDTVPGTGMPKLPVSIGHVVVVGVGDARTGRFIDGRQSRQDVSTLRQIATRLHGTYHDGNEKHLSTELVRSVSLGTEESPLERLTLREWALIACAFGASTLALLPLALHYAGTRWQPGVRTARARRSSSEKRRPSRKTFDSPPAPDIPERTPA